MEETTYRMVNITYITEMLINYCTTCADPNCEVCPIKMIVNYLKDPGIGKES
jgi:hypothetical protein